MPGPSRRSAILVFAKTPVPGTVKTRLIPALGDTAAAQLHAAMVTHTVSLAAQYPACDVQLWCAPDTSHPLFEQLAATPGLSLQTQSGADLGERMARAFETALAAHDAAVVIGTDCPTVTLQLLEQAFRTLNRGNDAVIAPAEDGGYVLLGLTSPAPQVFSGIDWGTERVCDQTLGRFKELHLLWERLPLQWDLDEPADLQRLISETRYSWHPQLRAIIEGFKTASQPRRTQ